MVKIFPIEAVRAEEDEPRLLWSYVLGEYELRCTVQEHINRGTATVSVVENGEHVDGREFALGGDAESWYRLYDYAASSHERHFDGAPLGV
jgi:hypothetical protein